MVHNHDIRNDFELDQNKTNQKKHHGNKIHELCKRNERIDQREIVFGFI